MSARISLSANLLVVVLATMALARVRMSNDLYVFPGGLTTGPIDCANLPTKYPNGSTFYCVNCVPGTNPCTCGVGNAIAERISGAWSCAGAGATGPTGASGPTGLTGPTGPTGASDTSPATVDFFD